MGYYQPIRRSLTTRGRIRVPPLDLIKYFTHGRIPENEEDENILLDIANDNIIYLTTFPSTLIAMIDVIPSYRGQFHPNGSVTLENNHRGHSNVIILVADLPECVGCSMNLYDGAS